MNSGERNRLITLQHATATSDDYGGETLVWTQVEKAYAKVRFGLASEKREAAQERAIQSATFEVEPTSALRAIVEKDRLIFDEDGTDWDITSAELLDLETLRFTATRSR